jgi:hypothetical protein
LVIKTSSDDALLRWSKTALGGATHDHATSKAHHQIESVSAIIAPITGRHFYRADVAGGRLAYGGAADIRRAWYGDKNLGKHAR